MSYWYVKDEFSSRIYFCSDDLNKCQHFANHYNENHKFSGQRMFKFNLYSFCGISLFADEIVDVNGFCKKHCFFSTPNIKYYHPLSCKGFHVKHKKYIDSKLNLIRKLCKKYHLWSYNSEGRKCTGFDF